MKKRILSLILALSMCLSMTPSTANAADLSSISLMAQEQPFSDWAMEDLIIGDTYGIYPVDWYNHDMTAPVSKGQMMVLMAGLRSKILGTDSVIKNTELVSHLEKYLTVEKVLDTFYTFLSGYEFTSDIGIKGKMAVDFMKENGIYGTCEGELALTQDCSVEQACVISTRIITYVFNKLDAASKGFLCSKVRRKHCVHAGFDPYGICRYLSLQRGNACSIRKCGCISG